MKNQNEIEHSIESLTRKLEELATLIERVERSSTGRLLAIASELIESGYDSMKRRTREIDPTVDRFIRPSEVAEILGYSWRTCKDKILPRFEIKPAVGSRGSQRFRKSDIMEIQRLLIEEGDRRASSRADAN